VSGSRLTIAVVAQDLPPLVGGTHVYNVEYARRLAARGHDVRVFTWEIAEPDPAESDAALPFEVHRQPFPRSRGAIEPDGVREALARWGCDVAFVSGGCGAVSRVVHAAAARVPTCVAVHDLRDKGRGRGRFGRWRVRRRYGFDRAAHITANSRHTRERLLRLGVPERRVSIVYPGVDLARFAPDPAAATRLRRELGLGDAKLLLTVSRLAPNKGHLSVIELLPHLRARWPDLVYAIVGEGGMRPALETRAAALGVRDALYFAGRVADAVPWYNACDVFVMASGRHGGGAKAGEGFGIAYVEAGACARPAVASASGGGAEIVLDGETGRVVDPEQPQQLEAALCELLADPRRARALGERARARVARFDWDVGAERLERVLREAAREGRGGRSGLREAGR
jgi:phosphatidylinositol alpha-1,6-mannosyltransferase